MSAPAAERGPAHRTPAPSPPLPTPQAVPQEGRRGWPDADVAAPAASVASGSVASDPAASAPAATGAAPTPTPVAAPPEPPSPASPAVPEVGPGAAGAETVRRMWPDVMARLAGIKRTTWSLVSHYAQVIDLDGKRLVLQFDSPGRAASFTKGAHQEFLRQALLDVLGMDCTFDAVAGEARTSQPAASAAVSAPAVPHASAPVSEAAPTQAPPADKPQAASSASRPPAAQATGAPPRRTPAPSSREDDIPLPPEPPPDDLPPEESAYERSRRTSGSRPSPAEGVAPPTAAPAPAQQRQPVPTIRLADDVPSVDDIDLEGSGLVGASVVEQLLGGRVIEERHDS
jgi:DNA polymerase-3 subunit gamma/tau